MALRLYDTMTREVRDVFAMDDKSVRFLLWTYCIRSSYVGNFRTLFYRMFFAVPLRQVE